MHTKISRVITFVAVLIASGGTQAEESIETSCDGASANAVLKLPAPLNQWGQIRCTVYGHTLTAKDNWVWSYPGAFAPVHLPAQMVKDNPKKIGHKAYFKSVSFIRLEETDANAAAEKINTTLSAKYDSKIESAYRLTLTNNEGKSHVALFVRTESEFKDGRGFWGFWCKLGCDGGSPFMLLNYEGKK